MAVSHPGFHAIDGWYFQRTESGGVRILDTQGGRTLELDEAGWASAVAAVTARGENSETFYAALKLHKPAA